MRLFIALELDDETREDISRVQAAVRAAFPSARLTRRENLHLTLAFIGETDPALIPELTRIMEDCAGRAFSLEISSVDMFRRSGAGGVLHLAARPSEGASTLAENISSRLSDAGFVVETRPFRAHITLAREVDAPRDYDFSDIFSELRRRNVEMKRLSLFESRRVQGVLSYVPLHTEYLK